MKKNTLSVFIVLLLNLFLIQTNKAETQTPPESTPSIALTPVQYPKVTAKTLPNGLRIYLLENPEVPVVEIFAYIQGGLVQDPSDKVGLAGLTGAVLRTGGTLSKTVSEIDQLLENRGASLDTGMSIEYGTAALRCLSEDTQTLVPLFFEILSTPRFEPDQINLAKVKMLESLKRQNDDPAKMAMREYPRLLYGNSSIWARYPNRDSIKNIHRTDLFDFHKQFYHPDRTVLAIAGDFKTEELLKLIQDSTVGWSRATHPLPTLPTLQKEWKRGIAAADRKGDQSTIIVGHFGDKRFNPDRFAITLMNFLLGGDLFSSRLGEEIRSNRGLAYMIFSRFAFETDYGLFSIVTQTPTEKSAEVIEVIHTVLNTFKRGEGVSQKDLDFAKQSILNQMSGQWDPPFEFVKEKARFAIYEYPDDYFEIFRQEIQKVTLEDIQRVSKNYLFPDKLQILVVGDLEKIKDSLRKWGEIQKIEKGDF